jgi:cell wall assembly regulator SMI1
MHDLWRQIEGILDLRARTSDSARERRGSLRPPVEPTEIAAAEAELGLPLHPDLLASLTIHDGQNRNALEVFTRWGLLPLAAALQTWRRFEELATNYPLGPGAWDHAWLPIASDGGGDYLLHDQHSGEVLRYRRGSSSRPRVAASLRAWLEATAADLPPEDDDYEIEDE